MSNASKNEAVSAAAEGRVQARRFDVWAGLRRVVMAVRAVAPFWRMFAATGGHWWTDR